MCIVTYLRLWSLSEGAVAARSPKGNGQICLLLDHDEENI